MKLKRIKKLRVNSYNFNVVWDKKLGGGSFDYDKQEIRIGMKDADDAEQFMILLHELEELAAVEVMVRFRRPDCDGDFIFCYDHRQHDIKSNLTASWLMQFLGD